MITTIPKKAPVLLLASVLVMGASASAATIYDNSVNQVIIGGNPVRFSTTLTGPTSEFGDEIIFAGVERTLTNFSFEYWALNNGTVNPVGFSPTAAARVSFYLNNGPRFNGFATPGPVPFYDSGSFLIGAPTDRLTFQFNAGTDFPAGGLVMPVLSNMTWTVQFSGLDADDSAGLDVFDPPVVGSSPAQENNRLDDYWEFSGGSWALKTNSIGGVGVNMNFAARFEAVPEPSTVILGVLGGLGLLVVGRRFIKAGK